MRGRLALSSAVLAALVFVATAAAENYQYKIVARDHAAAAAIVLKRTDLNLPAGWTGGATKPDRSAETESDRCNGYLPKQSDLVVSGDAESKFSYNGTTIDTQAQLLETPAMVQTDWQRSVGHPGYLACLKQTAPKQLPSSEHLISLTKLPYSTYGTRSAAYRLLLRVDAGTRTVRVALDFIAFYRGRTEVSVIISGAVPTATDLLVLKALDLKVADIVNAKTPAS